MTSTPAERPGPATPGPATPGPATPDPARWRALWVCLAVGFMTMLDVSIVNVALPSIESQLGAGPAELQLIVAGYTLAFGLVLVPAGRLGDVQGRRRLFVVGLVGFALTSLAAGLAPNDTVLALARLLQGASAGVLNPQVVGLIQQMFAGHERGRAFGLFGAVIGVSTAIGPLAGGLIIQLAGVEHGWRWVFFINVPIAAVVLPMALRLLPTGPGRPEHRPVLDGVGLLLIAGTTAAMMAPFVLTSGVDDDPRRWWLLVLAAALLAAVVVWERGFQARTGSAVIDETLVTVPSFRNGALLGMAYFGGFTSIFLVITLYLQGQAGMSALQAGLTMMPFAVSSGLSSWLSGRLVAKHGRALVVAGLVLVVGGLALTATLIATAAPDQSLRHTAVTVGAAIVVAGLGSGLVISPNQTLTLAQVPVARAGVGGSMLQVGQRVGSALGVSLAVAIFYAALARGETGERAASTALLVAVALTSTALVVAVIDLVQRRSESARARGQADSGAGGLPTA
ncbi:MAG: MFS transporter [Cellulomonadaceae bacterium]